MLPQYFHSLFLTLVYLVCAGPMLSAQNEAIQMEYFSLNDGLSDRSVTDIVQAADELIWIGTENGLNKFDGYEFKVFNDSKDSEIPLSNNNIKKIAENKDKDLVILYANTLTYFDIVDPLAHTCQKIRLFPEDGLKGRVRSIQVDNVGELFVLTVDSDSNSTNIYQYLTDNEFVKVLEIKEKYNESPSPIIEFIRLNDGSFLINDKEKGLRQVHPESGILKIYSAADFKPDSSSFTFPATTYFLHEDQHKRIWLSFYNTPGIYRIDPADFSVDTVPNLSQQYQYDQLWEDRKGNILVAQTRGVGYSNTIEKLHCLTPLDEYFDLSQLAKMANPIASAYSRNFLGYLFFGTNTGLKIVSNNRTKVKTFLAQNIAADRRGTVLGGITGDQRGMVYFTGESRYWYGIDTRTDVLDTFPLIDHATGQNLDFSNGLDLKYTPDNVLWGISSYRSNQGQLHRMDLETCTAVTYNYAHKFSAFTIERSGQIWLTCIPVEEKGLLVSLDPFTHQFTVFTDPEGKNPLKGTSPRYILQARDETLWIGTENGLFHINLDNAQVKQYGNESQGKFEGLSHNTIYVIYEDEQGLIWLGTKHGLNVLNPMTGKVTVYDKSKGLASNSVCGILPDDKGNFWISTTNGLSYFDTKYGSFQSFYQTDGLSSDEFNPFSFYRDSVGRYYFGGSNGMNAFKSEDLLISRDIPAPILTKLEIFEKTKDTVIIQTTNLKSLKELVISPSIGYFSLYFTLPVYNRSSKNQFQYRLEGLEGYEKTMQYLGNNPVLRYNNLAPGEYTLYMQGADPNGNWSLENYTLQIKVRQHFYKTGWFLLLVIILAVAIGFGLFKYQLEQRLKVERLRMKLSSDLHDEVSGLLSGIAMQTDLLQLTSAHEENRERLKAIGEVSRKAMSKMSDVIWSIDSRKDRLEDLIDRMQEHADEVLLPLGIRYDFNVGKLEKSQKIPVSVRQDLYFIFKEAVNNVAKHSKATQVKVTMRNNGNTFELTIKDNGVGRLSNQGAMDTKQNGAKRYNSKSGQGLSNLRMRAGRLSAHLDIVENGGYAIRLRMKKFA